MNQLTNKLLGSIQLYKLKEALCVWNYFDDENNQELNFVFTRIVEGSKCGQENKNYDFML